VSVLAAPVKKFRVLIVKDNHENSNLDKLIKQLEMKKDCNVVLSKNHAEGMKLLKTVAFCVAFVSISKVNIFVLYFSPE